MTGRGEALRAPARLDERMPLVHASFLRNPMPSALRSRPRQLSLFDETPFWDQSSLEAAILRETGREIRLTLTDNRSVLLSFTKKI